MEEDQRGSILILMYLGSKIDSKDVDRDIFHVGQLFSTRAKAMRAMTERRDRVMTPLAPH